MRRHFVTFSIAFALLGFVATTAQAAPPVGGSDVNGGFGVDASKHGSSGESHDGSSDPGQPTVVTVDCGSVAVEGRPVVPSGVCSIVHPMCDVASGAALPDNGAHNFVVVTTNPSGRQTFDPECGVVPATGRPRVTPELARAQAEKLLPHPRIGTAPAGGVTLVNIETVLWVDTPPDLTLGTVRLLGYRVTLRAHVDRVDWDFGDHTTAVTTAPEQAYSPEHPCTTAQCPDYFGHTYRHTGQLTVGAQLSWSGQFQVDGGPWQDIPGTVTAAATGTALHVKEARGVLVDNP
jgi:hypothetical protein